MESESFNIRTYRLDPKTFGVVAKRLIRQYLLVTFPFTLVCAVIPVVLIGIVGKGNINVWSDVLPAVGLGLVVLSGMVLWRQIQSGRRFWDSYELTMSDNVLRRQIADLPVSEILRPEVTKVYEDPRLGLTVVTTDRYRFIFIPQQLIGFAELRERLVEWKEFEPSKPAGVQAKAIGWTVLLLLACFGTGGIPDILFPATQSESNPPFPERAL